MTLVFCNLVSQQYLTTCNISKTPFYLPVKETYNAFIYTKFTFHVWNPDGRLIVSLFEINSTILNALILVLSSGCFNNGSV